MKLIKKIKSTIKSNNKNNVDSNQKVYYRVPGKTGNEKGECLGLELSIFKFELSIVQMFINLRDNGVLDDFFDDFNNFFDDIFSIFD